MTLSSTPSPKVKNRKPVLFLPSCVKALNPLMFYLFIYRDKTSVRLLRTLYTQFRETEIDGVGSLTVLVIRRPFSKFTGILSQLFSTMSTNLHTDFVTKYGNLINWMGVHRGEELVLLKSYRGPGTESDTEFPRDPQRSSIRVGSGLTGWVWTENGRPLSSQQTV